MFQRISHRKHVSWALILLLVALTFTLTSTQAHAEMVQYISPEGGIMDLGDDITMEFPEKAVGDADKVKDGMKDVMDRIDEFKLAIDLVPGPDADMGMPWFIPLDQSDKDALHAQCDSIRKAAKQARNKAKKKIFDVAHDKILTCEKRVNKLVSMVDELENNGELGQESAEDCRIWIQDKIVEDGVWIAYDNVGRYITAEVTSIEVDGDWHLSFIFGPHGTNFSPKAELWVPRYMVDFHALGNSFYSPDGDEYEEFDPSYNYTDEWVIFSIEHFSRYYFERR